MNCLEFRRAFLAEPASLNMEMTDHIKGCEACSRFASDMKGFESELKKSIDIEVPEGLSSRIQLRQRLATQQRRRRGGWLALAAGLVLGVVAIMGHQFTGRDPGLEQVVLQHINSELHHLEDRYNLDINRLNQVLKDYGTQVSALPGRTINYAGACQIRRQHGAHVVIDSKQGPVTVLLMPGEFVDKRTPVSDRRFQGVIVPLSNGSMAILGEDPEEVDRVEREFSSQLKVIS